MSFALLLGFTGLLDGELWYDFCMETEYKNDFEKFLVHTNEKRILLKEITKEIKKLKTESLLDIGAGNGLLATPLSKEVSRYLAIEPKLSFVEKLKSNGLDVVQSNFPVSISEKFDLILSSHSLSYDKENFEPFIREAFNLLNQNGVFLIITYRGQEDDWNNLLDFVGKKKMDYNRMIFNSIIELLNNLGNVTIRKVITKVTTDNLDDMIQALSFVFSDGKPEKKEKFLGYKVKLEKFLNSKYKIEHGYSFPFQHFFIMTQKTK